MVIIVISLFNINKEKYTIHNLSSGLAHFFKMYLRFTQHTDQSEKQQLVYSIRESNSNPIIKNVWVYFLLISQDRVSLNKKEGAAPPDHLRSATRPVTSYTWKSEHVGSSEVSVFWQCWVHLTLAVMTVCSWRERLIEPIKEVIGCERGEEKKGMEGRSALVNIQLSSDLNRVYWRCEGQLQSTGSHVIPPSLPANTSRR